LENLSQEFCVNKNTKKERRISNGNLVLVEMSQEPLVSVQAGMG